MNRKGFTLVELLGVVAILAVSLLVIIPSVTSMLRTSKVNEYEEFTKDLYLATETYINDNREKYPQLETPGNSVKVYIKELKEELLIKNNLKNPKTEPPTELDDTDSVTVTVTEGFEYTYEFNY